MRGQLLGLIPVGIYQDSVTEEVKYLLEISDSAVVIAEDQEQVDKVLEVIDKLGKIKKIIYYDDRGMYQYREDILIFFDEIIDNEISMSDEEVYSYLKEKVSEIKENDVAVMCTTSGTTGKPKLSMLTHKNLLFMSKSLAKRGSEIS